MGNRRLKIGLLGNPNCGKSSIFNGLTGLRQKISNYPGVTVDKKTGILKTDNKKEIELIDLPGTYSIYPKSKDEEVVYNILLDENNPDHPDAVLIVADASNLKRNLLLCSQIIDLKIPVVVALNMFDIIEKEGIHIDIAVLENKLGVPIVPTNARKGRGLVELKQVLSQTLTYSKHPFVNFDELFQGFAKAARIAYPDLSQYKVLHHLIFPERVDYLQDEKAVPLRNIVLTDSFNLSAFQAHETLLRYKRISDIYEKTVTRPVLETELMTTKIDRILTHKLWGYVIMAMFLFAVFQSIFFLAAYPMHLVESGTTHVSAWLAGSLPSGWLSDLIVNGLLAGVSGVIIFIPQIAILFALLNIMEDSGYMARVSFLTDRLMRSVGLNGKSIIPLVSGMACAIPAIMSTRSINNPKDRLITILVTPFISCSARLPVYTLVIAMFIPNYLLLNFINLQGLVLMSLYLFGVIMVFIIAFVLSKIIKGDEESFFVMELPLYRAPRWRNVLFTMYEKVKLFTLKAGKIILLISMVLWFLSSFGPADIGLGSKVNTEHSAPGNAHDKLMTSFAGQFGKGIEPLIRPMGFDWKMGIALLTSFAAREVFVGTMATIYSIESDDSKIESIRDKMLQDKDPVTGEAVYTLATGISLLLFFALAMQCMSTLAIVRRETKSWKWPLLQLFYMTATAYAFSALAFHLIS